MIRLDYLILGYTVFTVEKKDVKEAARLFLKHGIGVSFDENVFVASSLKTRKIEKIIATRVKYAKSDLRGLGGFLYKNRNRVGIFAALACTLFVLIFSSDFVWDVRIEGCESEDMALIEKELLDSGFGVGTRWSRTDMSRVEIEVLSNSQYVSWLNINRRGSVAYVKVAKKEQHEEQVEKVGYSNVVASCDAVIEEITVVHGTAAVQVGDSVKKGDLLISGVVSTESGTAYCYAEGIILGRVSDKIEVSIDKTRNIKVQKNKELTRCDLKILNFSANIFNSYRNLSSECDIIEKKEELRLFGVEVPISLTRRYAVSYVAESVQLTSEEMAEEASKRLADLLDARLRDATLLKIRTAGEFSENSYAMYSSFICLEKIGVDLPFEIK